MPDVLLVDQDGRQIRFGGHFAAREPVVVTFIYTTCTTVCPVVSTGFATLQAGLGDHPERVRLVSISLDPKHDTPGAMKAYLGRFRARPGWEYFSGTPEALDQVRKAFTQHVPGSGSTMPLSFIRSAKDGKWIRIAGPRTPSEFAAECLKEGIA